MAINLASFIQPKNATNPDPALRNTYYLLEDIFLKGGFQIRLDAAERDGINPLNRKAGMLVLTQNDNKIWTLDIDLESWTELKLGSEGPAPVLPTRKTITYLTLTDSEFATTSKLGLSPGAVENFEMEVSPTCMLQTLEVSAPCLVEIHSTPARDDTNPFKFVAQLDHLKDDGSTLMSDGSVVHGRRYSLLSNLELPVTNRHYFKVVNQSGITQQLSITATFFPLEI